MPASPSQSPISVKRFEAGTLDLPISGVRIADSSFVVFDSAKSKGGPGIAALFGSLGILLQNEAAKSDVSKGLGPQELKLVNLDELVLSALKTHTQSGSETKATFEVTPSGWIALDRDGEKESAKLTINLETLWRDNDGGITWRQSYLYRVFKERPLSGAEGWFSNDAAALRQDSGVAISKLVALFLGEAAGKQPSAETEIKLEGCFPLAKKITLIAEMGDELILRLQMNRVTGSWITVINRADCGSGR